MYFFEHSSTLYIGAYHFSRDMYEKINIKIIY